MQPEEQHTPSRRPVPPPIPPTAHAPAPDVPTISLAGPVPGYGVADPAHAMRWRDRIILRRYIAALPVDRCFRCNAPACKRKNQNLAWHEPAFYLLILIGLLIYVIVALCVRKKVSIEVGLCKKCAQRRATWITLAWSTVVISILLLVLAGTNENGGLAAAGVITLFVGLFWVIFAVRIAYPKRIDDRWVHIGGAGKAFRQNFPEGYPPY